VRLVGYLKRNYVCEVILNFACSYKAIITLLRHLYKKLEEQRNNYMHNFLKRPTKALGYMNIILLDSNYRHVSPKHVADYYMSVITT
jgi:hypothetical protein